MSKYIVKRILLLIPALILVCVVVFVLMRMMPGDAVDYIVNRMLQSGYPADAESVRESLGMDKPAIVQFFIWMGDVIRGDFGDSFFQHETVWALMARQIPISVELGLLTLIISNAISIPLGLWCAAKQDSFGDYAIRIASIILMAVPMFWLATLVLFYPAQWWGYSPPISYVGFFKDPLTNLQMMIVPALLGALAQSGMQLRFTRTMVLDTLRSDYVRTAYSKGVKEKNVLFRHAFRNAMIPVVTMIGGSVGMVVGGNVILENIFNIPGIGQQVVTALGQRDYPIVQGCVLVMSAFVMVMNLVTDIAYKWIDPRVTLE
jgi:peptide/nickel transport system permease protein